MKGFKKSLFGSGELPLKNPRRMQQQGNCFITPLITGLIFCRIVEMHIPVLAFGMRCRLCPCAHSNQSSTQVSRDLHISNKQAALNTVTLIEAAMLSLFNH